MEDYILFDDENKSLKLVKTNEECSYDEILNYHYIEEKGAIGGGGIGRAFSAGFGSGKGTYSLKKMYIALELKGGNILEIQLLITPTNSNTIVYKKLYKAADRILNKLEAISPKHEEERGEDFYEELVKLKKLLDMDIITKEDYNLKKKQILKI